MKKAWRGSPTGRPQPKAPSPPRRTCHPERSEGSPPFSARRRQATRFLAALAMTFRLPGVRRGYLRVARRGGSAAILKIAGLIELVDFRRPERSTVERYLIDQA